MSRQVKVTFLGAAKTVTGSKTLLQVQGAQYLVDCGLFQGSKEIRLKNWESFPNVKSLDGILLTHAHLDHSGYIPKIVKDGLRGIVYCSEGTLDLSRVLLRDAGRLQEEDAQYANRAGYSHHNPALPLYDEVDAITSLNLFNAIPRDQWVALRGGLNIKLMRSGHIIGSSLIQVSFEAENGMRLLTFTGDLGNGRSQILKPPVTLLETDYLVMESTYGDRLQPRVDPSIELGSIINKVMARRGVLVIPAFSVGRSQEILYLIRKLRQQGRIPSCPVYLDSPMANNATEIYLKHSEDHSLIMNGGSLESPFSSEDYTSVQTPDESMMLCMRDGPMIVISAAGMLTGGRVLHHLKHRLPRKENAVLFVGYQAEGTKGRLLQQGIPTLRIHHQEVSVEAEVMTMESLSAHADAEDMIQWLKQMSRPPKTIFLNHGEESAALALKARIEKELGFRVIIPNPNEEFILE